VSCREKRVPLRWQATVVSTILTIRNIWQTRKYLVPAPSRVSSFVPDFLSTPHQHTNGQWEKNTINAANTPKAPRCPVCFRIPGRKRRCVRQKVSEEIKYQAGLGALFRVTLEDVCLTKEK
jgi:hypothetical protein